MARRRKAEQREVIPDSVYGSEMISHMVNVIMEKGKKSTAQQIVYGALDTIKEQDGVEDPIEVLTKAIQNVSPKLEVKSRRVGGATYQVPLEVSGSRQRSLALRWIVGFSRSKRGVPMKKALAMELLDAYRETGSAIKKRDDTHKMAQANKAFAHYRW